MKSRTCVRNSVVRSSSGCTTRFQSEDAAHPLSTLDFSMQGSKGIPYLPNKSYQCTIKSAEYLLNATWKQLPKRERDTFSIEGISTWVTNQLKWSGAMAQKYFGYIMRVNLECKTQNDVKHFCVVFKAKGTLSWNIADPTARAAAVTTTLPTTAKSPTTATSARKVTTTMKSTTQVKSTMQVLGTTQVKETTQVKVTTQVRLTTQRTSSTTASSSSTLGSPSTVSKTTPLAKVTTSKKTTQANNWPSPISQKTSSTTSVVLTESSTESAAATTEVMQTESTVGDGTTVEPTSSSLGRKEPNKDRNKSEEEKEDGMMIAIVAGVVAVICVALSLLCVWLIISQRRKHRNGSNYDSGTTVIANPTTTNSQNHFPMPGLLKNPVFDDSVYAEPEEKVHKSAAGLLGNPSYETCDNLLLTNPGAKDTHNIPLNNVQKKPLNTAKRIPHVKENTYDCADVRSNQRGKPNEEKSVYQSLVNVEGRAHYRPEVNSTYQSLNPDGVMYQPLLKNVVQKCQAETPEYLALLNPSESTGKVSPSPPQYQPPYSTGPPPADVEESPEYADYADLDELEEISSKEASNRTSEQGPSYSAPLYDVTGEPGYDYAGASMYDVLEGPDPHSADNTNLGYEPPMYAVLEGPDTN